jgi:hypothetical protein
MLAGVVAVGSLCDVGDATAQVLRLRRFGGVVRSPYAPAVVLNPRIGIPGVGLARPYLLVPRIPVAVPPYVGARRLGPPPVPPLSDAPRYVPGATRAVIAEAVNGSNDLFSDAQQYLSPTDLAALDDGALLNEVLRVTAQLDADVSRFNTGPGWQTYLRLPADALPPATADGRVELGLHSILATISRLDSVAADPAYSMISGLPSFIAARAALGEVASRVSAGRGSVPAADDRPRAITARQPDEELPTPPPALAAPENSAARQRSIVVE